MSSFNSKPFNTNELGGLLDPSKSTYLQVPSSCQLYETLCQYVVAHSKTLTSFATSCGKLVETFDPEGKLQKEENKVGLLFGLGLFNFVDPTLKKEFILLHHTLGAPVGTNRGAVLFQEVVVFVPGQTAQQKDELQQFSNAITAWKESSNDKTYKIFSWHHSFQYWQESATKLIRPLDSVILPQEIKVKVLEDVDDFVQPETAKWYSSHGIPYKRSFLFYGLPGTGKSSLITVLAGHLGRNVCFLQPSDPKMTDESITKCILQAPKKSIIVIEDIDALFGKDRQTTHKSTPLTFSGLLNSLDGVANPDGQIFVLTTNYIERLDPALIRAGRVDVQVEFPSATEEQVKGMFLHFYKDASAELVVEFGKVLSDKFNLENEEKESLKRLTMAQLQQHFIKCRKCSPQDAVARLSEFTVED